MTQAPRVSNRVHKEGALVPAYPFNDVPGTSGPGKFVEIRLRIRLQPGVSDRH